MEMFNMRLTNFILSSHRTQGEIHSKSLIMCPRYNAFRIRNQLFMWQFPKDHFLEMLHQPLRNDSDGQRGISSVKYFIHSHAEIDDLFWLARTGKK